ncbi:hypothetical protein [Micromonospora sp. DT47]|uniref:hypothetical protein n=1 Tax=Micromonospora sp. DT47 TaxID=3393431 RepID=UPI003CF58CEF
MNGAAYRAYAGQQVAEARRTIGAHGIDAYTGICRSCGRPGPCDEQRAARTRLVHYLEPAEELHADRPP